MEKFNFGNRLKELRKSIGITQAQLAYSLHERRATLSNYENKNVYPGFNMLIKLADYFHVSVDYLTGRTDDYEINSENLEDTLYWVKISNPLPYKDNRYGIYALAHDTDIEFYNLSDLKKKYTRIYLPFLECAPGSKTHFKECYDFFSEFGFLGNTEYNDKYMNYSMFKKQCPGIYKENGEFNISKVDFSADLLMSNPELFSLSEEQKEYMKNNSLMGYCENIYDIEYFATEMKSLINNFLLYDKIFISRVNEKMRDINFYYDSNYKRKITFTSLLSYMYYELFEDYINGYYPYQCNKCGKYFLSRVKDNPQINHTCDDCKGGIN